MHVIFSHGRLGNPNGKKIQVLADIVENKGFTYESVDYTDTQDPDERAGRLIRIVQEQSEPFCLVGFSMGGYASLVASETANKKLLCGVFLLAPALYLPRYQQQYFDNNIDNIEVVHGWDDKIVLFEHSVRYASESGCTLHLFDDDHRFTRNSRIVGELFERFLQRLEENSQQVDLWW